MIEENTAKSVSRAVPAATILLVRDGADGLEVFMVKRHHEIEFGGGALVFPGGRTERNDCDPALAGFIDGAGDLTPEFRALCVAAIREAFEEAGVLLARDASGAFVTAARLAALDHFREQLEQEQIGLLALLEQEKLRLACDQLVPFAHWITPRNMPKRFDTHFFLAPAPPGHTGQHCGRESIDSLWVRPGDAIAKDGPGKLMFPTRMNLMKLAAARNVDEATTTALATPPVVVEPWIERMAEGRFVRIREDAGYAITRLPESEMM